MRTPPCPSVLVHNMTINRILPILALALALAARASAQIPAFPGAEGFGAWAKGGRGGDVYYVTNLVRPALDHLPTESRPRRLAVRTIMFATSGHIRLPSGSGVRAVDQWQATSRSPGKPLRATASVFEQHDGDQRQRPDLPQHPLADRKIDGPHRLDRFRRSHQRHLRPLRHDVRHGREHVHLSHPRRTS